MILLNLGCGEKTSDRDGVVNIDWSAMLRLRRHSLRRALVPLFLHGDRQARYRVLPDNILVHDLSKGIPFDTNSVDAVYHSHTLEHLDRDLAETMLKEVLRVLKPGGIHRIVVPDFERRCRSYVEHLDACDTDPAEQKAHDGYVSAILEQSVRREAHGTSQQRPVRRRVENMILAMPVDAGIHISGCTTESTCGPSCWTLVTATSSSRTTTAASFQSGVPTGLISTSSVVSTGRTPYT